ncbi:hypothetical protein [Schaalia georgiae]|uniref:hypothetical protein n=1 Tax=Schaalia georgiae TaxID=52768 RepID=UPI0005865693|nr:hypothetical protein [Schaalia georgiae]
MRKSIELTWTPETRVWGTSGNTSVAVGTGTLDGRRLAVYAFPQSDHWSFWSQIERPGGGSTSIEIRSTLPAGTVPSVLGPNGAIRETTTIEL